MNAAALRGEAAPKGRRAFHLEQREKQHRLGRYLADRRGARGARIEPAEPRLHGRNGLQQTHPVRLAIDAAIELARLEPPRLAGAPAMLRLDAEMVRELGGIDVRVTKPQRDGKVGGAHRHTSTFECPGLWLRRDFLASYD